MMVLVIEATVLAASQLPSIDLDLTPSTSTCDRDFNTKNWQSRPWSGKRPQSPATQDCRIQEPFKAPYFWYLPRHEKSVTSQLNPKMDQKAIGLHTFGVGVSRTTNILLRQI